MRVLLLDPGLSHRAGHNAAMLEEFAQHAALTPGFSVVCACSVALDAAAFVDIGCELRPVFRLNGYSGFLSDTESHESLLHDLLTTCLEDLAHLDLDGFDAMLMPTVYPIHLAAAAAWLDAASAPTLRVACGLLMPPRFWAGNARAALWLEDLMRDSVHALGARPNTVLYSESARYRLGKSELATPMLLPPWADANADQAVAHANVELSFADRTLRFGFFGAPTLRKGAQHLSNVLASGLPSGTSISIALPEAHAALATQWNDPARRIHAYTQARGNAQYLAAMADVDVVLAFYDPAAYVDQMSGIVAEAIALGKPLLVAQGCDAITGFLKDHAPGSCIAMPFSNAGLEQGMALSASLWRSCGKAALAAALGVQRLKHMTHYLRGIGIGNGVGTGIGIGASEVRATIPLFGVDAVEQVGTRPHT